VGALVTRQLVGLSVFFIAVPLLIAWVKVRFFGW
jgi:hypothetical protein